MSRLFQASDVNKVNINQLMNGLIAKKELPDLDITGIAYDSRRVKKGDLFIAISGLKSNGHQFISDAVSRGAAAVVGTEAVASLVVPYLRVQNIRATLATLAARFYGEPTLKVPIIGITGTNGKTTCTYLLEAILKVAHYSPAVLGTINYRYGKKNFVASHTTPEAPDLQRCIAEALATGANAVVMEVSSHALTMERVRDCHFDTVLFTNLSQDHLDYHASMEEYYSAKRRLFREYLLASKKKKKTAILNWQDPYGRRLAEEISAPSMRCGYGRELDYHVVEEVYNPEGITAIIETPHGHIAIQSHLIGAFNLQNILLTIAAAHTLNIPNETIAQGIAAMHAVPGRLQPIEGGQAFSLYVDYAHTPDALRAVLSTLRPLTKRRLITLFGCGGDRDRSKRPLMGNIAAKLSDIVIVTSDNPRTEDPQKIIEEILPGLKAERFHAYHRRQRRGYLIEPDRKTAIQAAISLANRGDIVLIAGKGHEDYQILGTQKISFDDRQIVREILQERK